MVLAVAFEDAKKNQTRTNTPERGGGVTQTPLFSFRDQPHLPHASLNQLDAGRKSSTHFHIRDQFQVVINGSGTLGRHDITPYTVHFSRAYTPYGPLVSGDSGLTFFVMRTRRDAGTHRVAEKEKRDMLQQVAHRNPWQITRRAVFPSPDGGDTVLHPIPDINDEKGLAAYTLRMKPHAKMTTPDPARGDGQYVIVLTGSLWYDNREYEAYSMLFAQRSDGPLAIQAGAGGFDGMVLNFPELESRELPSAAPVSTGKKKWQCQLCAFYYDEALGMPDEGVAPGTSWVDIPDTWTCPDCGAGKGDFNMVEVS